MAGTVLRYGTFGLDVTAGRVFHLAIPFIAVVVVPGLVELTLPGRRVSLRLEGP
jgi:hypothetical protein